MMRRGAARCCEELQWSIYAQNVMHLSECNVSVELTPAQYKSCLECYACTDIMRGEEIGLGF